MRPAELSDAYRRAQALVDGSAFPGVADRNYLEGVLDTLEWITQGGDHPLEEYDD